MRAARESGQAVVEFVLVLPFMLLLLFGIVDFGLAINYSSDLNHVAAQGARQAAVNSDPAFNVATYVKEAAEPSIGDDVAVSVCLPPGPGGIASGQPGAPVTIKATYSHKLLHLLPGKADMLDLDLSGRATMRLEAAAAYAAQASTNADACE